jgi:outer membrane protein insertion porin family
MRMLVIVLLVSSFALPCRAGSGDDPQQAKRRKNPFVNRIIFHGNKSFSAGTLKKKMYTKEPSMFAIFTKPRLNWNYLRRDIAAIEAFYHSQGYFEAAVKLEKLQYLRDDRFVDIIIGIAEGQPTIVSDVELSKSAVLDMEAVKKKLMTKRNRPFNPSLLETDKYMLKNECSKRGYPAALATDSLAFHDHEVAVYFAVDPGPKIRIDRVTIKGNRMTRDGIIIKEITFKEGEVFNLDKLLESRRNLFDTGLFTEVELKPEHIDLKRKTVDISARVRERKSTYIEFGFGVGNVLGSRALAEWGDRNLFGTGRKIRLKAQYSFDIFKDYQVSLRKLKFRKKYARYDGEFNQRHLFGTKVLTGLNAFYEEDATVEPIDIKTLGASVIANRRMSRYTDLFLSFSHERITRELPDLPREKSTSRILSGSITRDKRDFILNPTSGSYRSLRLQIAGGLLGGDNDFYTMSLAIQKYIRLGRRSVVALRLRTGYADAFGPSASKGVPIENRFFTGGSNSVRGYKENSLGPKGSVVESSSALASSGVTGGRVLLLTNVEMRLPLPLLSRFNVSGAFFVDGGNVWGSLRAVKARDFRLQVSKDAVSDEDYRYSVGMGLRYNTPVGPIRLDYGIPVKREAGMDKLGRFHVSLGQIF